MKEEMIDVELNLGKEDADRLRKMTKTQLTNAFVAVVLKTRVQRETIGELERGGNRLKNEIKETERRLVRSEEYVEQARKMIDSVMERWYSYEDE